MADLPAFYERDGINPETYDSRSGAHISVGPVSGDAAWYARKCREWGGQVLEGACGPGRVAWHLAEAGIEVVGFDLSPHMLARAEAKRATAAPEAAARVRFMPGDLRTFALGRKFRTALVPFRSFQILLTPEDQRACLDRFREHLEPGGHLVIDLFDPLYAALTKTPPDSIRPRSEVPLHGGRVLRQSIVRDEVDPVTQVLSETWTFEELDSSGKVLRTERERLRMRWSFRWEMRHLFALAGFEVEAEYSDFKESPPAYAKEQIWVLRARP
jgi:SAM-dependent methyltransferase